MMKKLISFIALLVCISINAVERIREPYFTQIENNSSYIKLICEDVEVVYYKTKGIVRYTQGRNFDSELYYRAMAALFLGYDCDMKQLLKYGYMEELLGYIKKSVKKQEIILFNVENKPINDGCPPGFSCNAIEKMQKDEYYFVCSFDSEKPDQKLTETRLSRIIGSEINSNGSNIQRFNISNPPTHCTGIMVKGEVIVGKDDAGRGELARKKYPSGDGGRWHKDFFTMSITYRTDGGTFCRTNSDSRSLKTERSKTKKSKKSSNPFAD